MSVSQFRAVATNSKPLNQKASHSWLPAPPTVSSSCHRMSLWGISTTVSMIGSVLPGLGDMAQKCVMFKGLNSSRCWKFFQLQYFRVGLQYHTLLKLLSLCDLPSSDPCWSRHLFSDSSSPLHLSTQLPLCLFTLFSHLPHSAFISTGASTLWTNCNS